MQVFSCATFEVVAFADEESTMVGCKGMAGTASAEPTAYATSNGEPIDINLKRIGGHWPVGIRPSLDQAVAAFLELHVEQGLCWSIVVTPLVSLRASLVSGVSPFRWRGPRPTTPVTPMTLRKDALAAASRLCSRWSPLPNSIR